MTLSAPLVGVDALGDDLTGKPVVSSEVAFSGMVWDVRRDRVDLGEAGQVTREYVDHPGAVSVLALRERDADGSARCDVALIKQYRHPVRATEWELPAGLLDIAGEPPHVAAARELAEEADLRAGAWHVLADLVPSPGGISEAIRIFLARDLSDVPAEERHERDGEELGMPLVWIDLDDAVDAVRDGLLGNAVAQLGILHASTARARGWAGLRAADAPFRAHPGLRG